MQEVLGLGWFKKNDQNFANSQMFGEGFMAVILTHIAAKTTIFHHFS